MSGDFTRSRFRSKKRYGSVSKQQGRVQLDADLNEHADIVAELDQLTRVDLIGRCGFPRGAAGFEVGITPDGGDLTLSRGRGYVGGLLCECRATATRVEDLDGTHAMLQDVVLDGRQLVEGDWVELTGPDVTPQLIRVRDVNLEQRAIGFASKLRTRVVDDLKRSKRMRARRMPTYLTQPYFPGVAPEALKARRGTYLVYLDVWRRHVTAVEDPSLHEVGLGGQAHATRTQPIWQVKLKLLGGRQQPRSCAVLPSWETLIPPTTGSLRARTTPGNIAADQGVGESPSGYRGLENHLYRVEIHDGGDAGTASFKWTRDSDSGVVPLVDIEAEKITVTPDRDGIVWFRPGEWVELTDDSHDLSGRPGTMVKITKVDGDKLIIDRASPTGELDLGSFPVNPRLRRWRSPDGVVTATSDEFIEFEDGIEVAFARGHYNSGDHWLIPARTATAEIEWPRDSARNPLAKPKDGVVHHYCAVALLRFKKKWEVVEDCRPLYSPLTAAIGRK